MHGCCNEKYTKPALTFTQQLEQLKHRGLVAQDDEKTLSQSASINYIA